MLTAPSLIFITGGVRSGKSSFAEKLAEDLACKINGRLTYIATGVSTDQEMKERIHKHQLDRETRKYRWKTIEAAVNIGTVAEMVGKEDVILLDCVTTLLNNELFSLEQKWEDPFLTVVRDKIELGLKRIREQAKVLIVVSNEVLCEPLNGNELVLTYSRLLGHIHQSLVEAADQAYLVEAGVPVIMKGD